MSDLIDRRQAIDVIDKEQKEIDVSDVSAMYAYSKCKTIIKQLPPAQLGTNLAEVGTDCISRQAAIDYFVTNVGFHDEDGYPIEDECELREIWTGYFDGIPSAQPKRGEWIHRPEIGWGEMWMCNQCGEKTISTVMGKPRWNFCPNCGADMRGSDDE